MQLFNIEICPRKLTIEQQKEYAKAVGKSETVNVLIEQEFLLLSKYNHALNIDSKNEAEDYKVMLNVIDLALKYSSN